MVPRKPKLIAAAAVLATGVLLAWPLRRSEPLRPSLLPVAKPSAPVVAGAVPDSIPIADERPAIVATPIGLLGESRPLPFAAADELPLSVTAAKALADENAATTPSTATSNPLLPTETAERVHVVHPGDSLERLAKRYLGDEGRALELFDLNRQVLENPHLLPIGAELRLPTGPAPALDSP
jgi:nucleoid-associated protein YgaU